MKENHSRFYEAFLKINKDNRIFTEELFSKNDDKRRLDIIE